MADNNNGMKCDERSCESCGSTYVPNTTPGATGYTRTRTGADVVRETGGSNQPIRVYVHPCPHCGHWQDAPFDVVVATPSTRPALPKARSRVIGSSRRRVKRDKWY